MKINAIDVSCKKAPAMPMNLVILISEMQLGQASSSEWYLSDAVLLFFQISLFRIK